MLQPLRQIGEARGKTLPVVERRLQRRDHGKGIGGAGQIARDHDKTAVAAMLERSEFHVFSFLA